MGKNLTELSQQLRELEPFGFLSDMKEKSFLLAENGQALLEKEPLAILRAIALAAEWEFTLDGPLLAAMQKTAQLLENKEPELIREEFEWVLMAKHASVGLQMALAANVLPYVLGQDCFPPKSRSEENDFAMLMEHIDKTKFEPLLRYGLLFVCFEKNRAAEAVRRLHFPPEEEALLVQAPELVVDLHFAVRPLEFKRFLAKHGMETYEFMESITKQHRKMYDQGETRILSRFYLLQEFEKNQIAIFQRDLKIDESDLEALGVTDEETKRAIMQVILNDVHLRPQNNKRELLLKKAERYRNPLMRALGKVKWIK